MKKQHKRTPFVVEHLEGISREAINRFPELVTEFARGKSGVYALYKGDSLYYVGLAKNLRSRLHHHLRDRHAGEWNRFSIHSVGAYNHTPYNDHTYRTKSWANIYSPLPDNPPLCSPSKTVGSIVRGFKIGIRWIRFVCPVVAYNHTPHNDRLIKPHEGR